MTEALTLEFWWMAYGTLLLFGEKQSITVYVCVCVVGGGGTVPKQWKTCILTVGVVTIIQRNWVSFNFFKPLTNVNMKFLLCLI